MHRIDAKIAGANLADDGVEIGPIAIDEPAGGMHCIRDGLEITLEQTAGIGICDHHGGYVGSEAGLQRRQINPARCCRRDVLDPVAGKGCGCGIGAMGAFGDQNHCARIAARLEGGADTQQPAQLAMRARLGRHRNAVHPGQCDQPLGQLIDDLQRPAHRMLRLEGVDIGKPGQPGNLLIKPRIVLHRARAKRERPQIDGIVLAAEASIMTHRFGLGQTGQSERRGAEELAQRRQRLMLGRFDIDAAFSGAAQLENQRFFQHQGAIAAGGG